MKDCWPWLLVFEDDAWPKKDAGKLLLQSIPDIFSAAEKGSTDTVAIGNIGCTSGTDFREEGILVSGIARLSGSHAYILFSHAYKKYIDA